MHMDTPNILLPTHPPLFTMCNGCMSGRVQNSTPYWSPNGKQPPHKRSKHRTTTRQAWWQIIVSRSCRSTIIIWQISLKWCLNELYVFRAYVLELSNLFVLYQACVIYNVQYFQFVMCRTTMCYVLHETIILYMCRIMSFKPNYICLQLFVLLHAYACS
jgi:hypothetical protein